MFGWRRRSEGFEWKEYVRTTVLVRRADRQRRIDDARLEVLAKVKDTRDRGVAAGRAGLDAAAHKAQAAAAVTGNAALRFLQSAFRAAKSAAAVSIHALAARLPQLPQLSLPSMPRVSLPSRGDRVSSRDNGFRLPFSPRLLSGAALAITLVLVGGPMLQSGTEGTAARFVATTASPAADHSVPILTGRATAISGDLVRIDGRLVRLTGIEQPDAKHPCFKSNGRKWNCSSAARTALDKLLNGKSTTCVVSGEDEEGRLLASCRNGDGDIGESLVRGGYVFASSGFFATYGPAEKDARAAKVGLWQGETVRPEDWRVQVWEDAKRSAPDGCPIKGFTRASDKLYALPWQQAYDGAKVRTAKGDRWFCSEDEAKSAGFRSASRS